ncbi:hypothetical protein [Gimesia maris]|uniref:hypothetical protein n=1 Tax=Gimesia maris TaxID=122 RepID=UPI0036F2EC86
MYRVGQSGLLVHNASIPTKAPKAGLNFGCEYVSGDGSLDRNSSPSLASNITVRDGYGNTSGSSQYRPTQVKVNWWERSTIVTHHYSSQAN